MIQTIIAIATLYVAVLSLILTDNTKIKYTDYEKRLMLRKANILHQ